MLNAKGEVKDLCELFKDTPQGAPPAGTGECALPKLLQYAYLHQLYRCYGRILWGNRQKKRMGMQGTSPFL